MRHWLSYLSLLALAFGIVAGARAEPGAVLLRSGFDLLTLKEERKAFVAAEPDRTGRLLEAVERAAQSKILVDEEKTKLTGVEEARRSTGQKQQLADLTLRSSDLDAAIKDATAQVTPELLRKAIDDATTSVKNAAATAETALAAATLAPTPEEFVTRQTQAITRGTAALQTAERYRYLVALANDPKLAVANKLDPTVDPDKARLEALLASVGKARDIQDRVAKATAGNGRNYITRVVRLYFFQNSEHMLRNLASPGRTLYRDNAKRIEDAEADLKVARDTSRAASEEFTRLQIERITSGEAVQRAQRDIQEAELRLTQAKAKEAGSTQRLSEAERAVVRTGRAKTDAADERMKAEGRLTDASAKVGPAKTVRDEAKMKRDGLQKEVKDLRAKPNPTDEEKKALVTKEGELREAERDLRPKQRELDEAESEASGAQKAVEDRKAAEKDATRAEEDAVKRRDAVRTEHDNDATAVTNADTALNGVQGGDVGARGRLKEAGAAIATAAANAVRSSQEASRKAAELAEAKVALRGTPAPLIAVEIPAATDPIDRVRIQADAGGVLMLRGEEKDVDAAIAVIRSRDRPGAQVRAIFWTLQINGADTPRASRRLKEAIDDINDQMMLARGQVALSGTTLRDALVYVYSEYRDQNKQLFDPKEDGLPNADRDNGFYPDDVARLLRLGKGLDSNEQRGIHPMNVATYGEAAAVLALAKREYQKKVIDKFLEWLPNRLANLEMEYRSQRGKGDTEAERKAQHDKLVAKYRNTAKFLRLRNYFQYEIEDSLQARELEEQEALRNGAAPSQASKKAGEASDRLAPAYDPNKMRTGDDTPGPMNTGSGTALPSPTVAAATTKLNRVMTPAQQEAVKFWAGVKPGFWLQLDASMSAVERAIEGTLQGDDVATVKARTSLIRLLNAGEDTRDFKRYDKALSDLLRQYRAYAAELKMDGLYSMKNNAVDLDAPVAWGERLFRRQEYSRLVMTGGALDHRARVAAMDASIRRLMQATEADLEMQFINPVLREIRDAASRRGVTLGTIERNGVIAVNRSPARVDPKATFEIQLPPQVNWLKEVRNAASLAAAVQSGAFGGLLSQLEQTRPSTLDDQPGAYFVESGNEVEFTPIVGPDGQAIRMAVKFHRDAPVRLPNREKGQNFGKIERHNVDTDVQDTNFELLEIARFENQTTIGENRRRQGGFPILNQIPVLQEIPLIGYFTRERERVIGNQQSLIFLQTAIYPSIEDLLGLFSESESNNPN